MCIGNKYPVNLQHKKNEGNELDFSYLMEILNMGIIRVSQRS